MIEGGGEEIHVYKYLRKQRQDTGTIEERTIPKRKRQALVNWSMQEPTSEACLPAWIGRTRSREMSNGLAIIQTEHQPSPINPTPPPKRELEFLMLFCFCFAGNVLRLHLHSFWNWKGPQQGLLKKTLQIELYHRVHRGIYQS